MSDPTENTGEITAKHPGIENLIPWKPGQSGNPGGRPKKKLIDKALEDELEALDSAEAVKIAKALVQLASKDVAAARLIAERTEGKPIQKVEHSGPDGGAMQGLIRVEFVKA